jgi:hypothetical protein
MTKRPKGLAQAARRILRPIHGFRLRRRRIRESKARLRQIDGSLWFLAGLEMEAKSLATNPVLKQKPASSPTQIFADLAKRDLKDLTKRIDALQRERANVIVELTQLQPKHKKS